MANLTIKQIKDKLANTDIQNVEFLEELEKDQRVGVKKIVNSWYTKQQKEAVKMEKFKKHFLLENNAKQKGYKYIAGVDEVGRGPLAGPVVACAVILKDDFSVYEVNDSKQISDKKRHELYPKIVNQIVAVGFGIVDVDVIDEINIYESSRVAMKMAINELKQKADYLLIDAMSVDLEIPQEKIIKGDAKSVSIGAASILAKVKRDTLMQDYAIKYPGYAFEKNAGYGTKQHLQGLEKLGITPIHRKSFAPVKNYIYNE